jgi:hypothetical protein
MVNANIINMKSERKKIEQGISNVDGDVVSPIVDGGMRDFNYTKTEKSREFEIGIDSSEKIIVDFARFLLSHLGVKKFLALLITSLVGSGGVLLYEFNILRQNTSILSDMFLQILAPVVIFIMSLLVGLSARDSACKSCGLMYGTVPVKRKVLKSGKYDGYIHHTIEETRKCRQCGTITTRQFVEKEVAS